LLSIVKFNMNSIESILAKVAYPPRTKNIKHIIEYYGPSSTEAEKRITTMLKKYSIDEILLFYDERFMNSDQVYKKISCQYHRLIFSIQELQYDVLKNIMVPEHEIVEYPEINHPDRFKYPSILTYDPIIRRINGQINDVIKITRTNSVYYRIVKKDMDID
jgi:DNA-directed RNA polymerase subunit H (RpoH/RPB5)